MSSNVSTIRVLINSRDDRQPSDSTHKWTTYFRSPVGQYFSSRRKVRMSVSQINIPNNSYPVSIGNQRIYYVTKLISDGSETLKFIDLPTDRLIQNSNVLAQLMQSKFSSNGDIITVNFDENIQRLKFKNDISGKQFRLVSSRQYENDWNGELLFNRGNLQFGLISDMRNEWVNPYAFHKAIGVVDLQRTSIYYIECNVVRDTTITPNGQNKQPIICAVPAGHYGTTSVFNPHVEQWFDVLDSSIDNMSFSVVDDDGELIDLYGGNVSMTLKFEFS